MVRTLAWLVVGGLASCAGARDMSSRTGPAQGPEQVAVETPRVSEEATTLDPQDGTPAPGSDEVAGQAGAAQTEGAAAGPSAPASSLRPPGQWLGRTQKQIEQELGALRFAGGWATPAGEPTLQLQFRGGRCVGIRGHVPEDMDCLAVASWLGYANAYPLRRADRCEWPGISPKHRLAEDVAGSYVPATREFSLSTR